MVLHVLVFNDHVTPSAHLRMVGKNWVPFTGMHCIVLIVVSEWSQFGLNPNQVGLEFG